MDIHLARPTRVDVRDMQCAQALAQASHAVKPLAVGQALEVLGNASDVKDDVLIWARELGHAVLKVQAHNDDWVVAIRKGRDADA